MLDLKDPYDKLKKQRINLTKTKNFIKTLNIDKVFTNTKHF